MNNVKWRKLFEAIESNEAFHFPAHMKIVGSEYVYTQTRLNQGVGVNGKYTKDIDGGPVAYKYIEWIYVPSSYEIERYNRNEKLLSNFIKNDIEALKEFIDSIGNFEYDFDKNGIKIYGYK